MRAPVINLRIASGAAARPTCVGLALLLLALSSSASAAPRDACANGKRHRGAAIDLDVKGADVHDVFRLLAKVGKTNIVVADDVRGRVTLTLKTVPWDQVMCTIAAVHRLRIAVDGNVLLVTAR